METKESLHMLAQKPIDQPCYVDCKSAVHTQIVPVAGVPQPSGYTTHLDPVFVQHISRHQGHKLAVVTTVGRVEGILAGVAALSYSGQPSGPLPSYPDFPDRLFRRTAGVLPAGRRSLRKEVLTLYPSYPYYGSEVQCKNVPLSFPPQHQSRQPGMEYLMVPRPISENPAYRGSGKLQGKVALVTGGDSGIGRAVSIAFAKEGADVVIVYLDDGRMRRRPSSGSSSWDGAA